MNNIVHIQHRRGTAEALETVNEVLLAGEIGIEIDTGKFKIGDGEKAWNALDYAGGGGNITDSTNDILNYHNSGAHNALYRGKNLGSALTEAQTTAINAGTFENLYPGDYWEFSDVPYTYIDENNATQTSTYSGTMRVADLDYYLLTGDQGDGLETHHIVVVPDTGMFSASMNATYTTEGGYVGSKMRTVYLRRAEAIFKACFGESHVLKHREYLVNAVANGRASGGAWCDSVVELLDERMAYGAPILDSASTDGGNTIPNRYSVSCKQLNLFRHRPDLISNRQWYWLRNVVSGAYFAGVGGLGGCDYADASHSGGVRPASLIC